MEDQDPTPNQWRRFLRIRRSSKTLRKRARRIEGATLKHAHRFIVHRIDNLRESQRAIFGWIVLVALLIGTAGLQMLWSQQAYTTDIAADEGTYAEGVVGKLDTLNPLFATTSAERSASALIFSSLLTYDQTNHITGDLAKTWTASADGTAYTLKLRDNVRWHDGAPLTADDVVFTVELMKNPLVRYSQANSWVGIGVKKIDAHTVQFLLPSAYAPFPNALTFGILPKHILGDVQPDRLRESDFNRSPIGSGPFEFSSLQVINPDTNRLVLHLSANKDYYLGAPRLTTFQLHTYADSAKLRQGFMTNEINAAADLNSADVSAIKTDDPTTRVADAPLYDGVYALFRNDADNINDVNVRRAIVQGTDRSALISALGGHAKSLPGPLVTSQYTQSGNLKQARFNLEAAKAQLTALGWIPGSDGIRVKAGVPLRLTAVSPKSGDYPLIANKLATQWRALGIDVHTQLVDPDSIQQNVLLPRAYDVLIYELAIGVDPDVFAYWHSSQANLRGFNLANYRSPIADDALASARIRSDTNLRDVKYNTFVAQWLTDAPAVALYQPTLHYVATENSRTLSAKTPINDASGRYRMVQYWTVDRERGYTTP